MVAVTGRTAPGRDSSYRSARRWRRGSACAVLTALLLITFSPAADASPIGGSACNLPGINLIPGLCGSGVIGKVAGSAVGGAFDRFTDSVLQAYQTMLGWALAWWIKLPTPALDSSNSELMSDIHDHVVEIQVIGLTVSVMFFAARMAWNRKQGLVDDAEDGFKLIFRASLATSFIPLALTVGGQISDRLSDWMVSEAIGAHSGGDGQIIKNFLHLEVLTGGALGSGGLALLGIVGFLGACLQLAFLVVRQAMLLMVVAGLPVAASFSGTGPGSQAYQKLLSWSVAFLLFKPVGALCYFIAFKAAGSTSPNEQQVVLGMVLMALCGFVLPSLMRLMGGGVTGSMGQGASGAAATGALVGAAVTAGSLAAGGGAGAAAGGGASGASSLGARSAGPAGAGVGGGQGGSPPPGGQAAMSPGSSQKPGPQPGLSSLGETGGSGVAPTGTKGGGAKEALTDGGLSAAGVIGASSTLGGEADGGDEIQMQPQPRLQSGWGDHAVSR